MTLQELCEPLFQAICRLNRSARKGLSPDYHQVRAEITSLLADMKSRSRQTTGLAEQFDKIELPLIFFVDSMVAESALPFARTWNDQRLAEELNPPQLAGDERFFDLLDETLADRGPGAPERLQIFALCMGLGFTGFYAGQPEYLRRKMSEIHARIRGLTDAEAAARICPEAYDNVNTANLVEPPSVKLVGYAIALVGFIIVILAANFTMYHSNERELRERLQSFVDNGPAKEQP